MQVLFTKVKSIHGGSKNRNTGSTLQTPNNPHFPSTGVSPHFTIPCQSDFLHFALECQSNTQTTTQLFRAPQNQGKYLETGTKFEVYFYYFHNWQDTPESTLVGFKYPRTCMVDHHHDERNTCEL